MTVKQINENKNKKNNPYALFTPSCLFQCLPKTREEINFSLVAGICENFLRQNFYKIMYTIEKKKDLKQNQIL